MAIYIVNILKLTNLHRNIIFNKIGFRFKFKLHFRLLRGSSYNADSATPGASSSPSQPSLSPRSSLSSASPPPPPPSYNQVSFFFICFSSRTELN